MTTNLKFSTTLVRNKKSNVKSVSNKHYPRFTDEKVNIFNPFEYSKKFTSLSVCSLPEYINMPTVKAEVEYALRNYNTIDF